MKYHFIIFVVGIFIAADAFCVNFPVPQSVSSSGTGIDLPFVAFPKPQSETSFLKATQFPKTFQDVPFEARIEILREGYLPYQIEYDENGVCISNCAYHGITIIEDMAAVDEATEEIAQLIEDAENDLEETDTSTMPENQPPSNSGSGSWGGTSGSSNSGSGSGGGTSGSSNSGSGSWGGTTEVEQDWCRNGKSTKLPLRYPVDMSRFKYRISSDFGFRKNSPNGSRFHPAIDIACPSGTPVYSTADGVVVTVGNETKPGGAGHYINIKHDNGLITQYLHLSKILVEKNQRVNACQQIALSGNSGTSTGGKSYAAHLDYRIRFNSNYNKYVDILCPCKVSNRQTNDSSDNEIDMTCAHSLFYSPYKFQKYNPNTDGTKRSLWRVEHGHCMIQNTDLLPDEVTP